MGLRGCVAWGVHGARGVLHQLCDVDGGDARVDDVHPQRDQLEGAAPGEIDPPPSRRRQPSDSGVSLHGKLAGEHPQLGFMQH